jgi:hypothetical protein
MMLTRFSRYSPTKRILESATLYDVTYVDGEDNPLAVFNFSYRSRGKAELPHHTHVRRNCPFANFLFPQDLLEKELLRQANESKIKRETAGKKRRQTQQMAEDMAYLSDDNELLVTASGSARKARRTGVRAEIETINLIDDLEDN